jgi:hypothetical protein
MDKNAIFKQIAQHYQEGDRTAAYRLTCDVLRHDPNAVQAWFWLSTLVDTADKQRDCLERILVIDPQNITARNRLENLKLDEILRPIGDDPAKQREYLEGMLAHDPQNILLLERLVGNDPTKQREYVERMLASDPQNAVLLERLEDLKIKEILRAFEADQAKQGADKLGTYLVEMGYITPPQLDQALEMQRDLRQREGSKIMLGGLLVQLGFVVPQSVGSALLQQQTDRLRMLHGASPSLIGEYLIVEGLITREQLEEVLIEQITRRQAGEEIRMGELLLEHGYITQETLDSILDLQWRMFQSRFGD